jgi:sugar lactone lactonase YvrE
MKKLSICLSILFLSTISYIKAQDITFKSDTLYPEGIAYHAKRNVFFVSSLRHGKIGIVDRKGKYKVFVNSPELISAIGIRLNEKTNTLYVCTSDPGVSTKTSPTTQRKFAKLIAYDATTGKQKYIADLGALNPTGLNFANDVTFDNEGNTYVTNSFSPIIYKINEAGIPSIFASYDEWKGDGFKLNGIVFHPDGFLIVAVSNPGTLYKVSLKNPKSIKKINAMLLLGIDGLIYNAANKELIAISNSAQEIYRLKTDNNWDSVSLAGSVKSLNSFPTTGTIVNDSYFILNAKLNELFNPTAEKTSTFIIQEVKF